MTRYTTHVTTGTTTSAPLTHGRTRARHLETAVLVLFCFACVVAFFALALGLALLILVVIS